MIAMQTKARIVLIGSYPPPIGGCSVHIQRLKRGLESSYDTRVVDFYGKSEDSDSSNGVCRCGTTPLLNLAKAVYYLYVNKCDIMHFHVSQMNKFVLVGHLFLLLFGKNIRKVLTIHSGNFTKAYEKAGRLRKYLTRRLLKGFDHIVTVSEEQLELINREAPEISQISLIPAFMPPDSSENEDIREEINLLRKRCGHIIISSGYAVPLYGFDIIFDAIELLEESQDIGLVLCLYNCYDDDYYRHILSRCESIRSSHIFNNISPEHFNYLLEQVDIYVRASYSDGDCVAIREAAHHAKPVIASNCVKRPAGCYLFETGNPKSLCEVLKEVIRNMNDSSASAWKASPNALDKIIAVYDNLLGRSST